MAQNDEARFYIGYVASVDDKHHAERIKAVIGTDRGKALDDVPFAFPLIPKLIHIKPKVGEAVIILIPNVNALNAQRYYIGPIISQPQKFRYDSLATLSATKLLDGGMAIPQNSVDNIPLSSDIFPTNNEVALIGRDDSEIILGDNDIRLRCGVRVTDFTNTTSTVNGKKDKGGKLTDSTIRTAPSFIKLKYYKDPLKTEPAIGELHPHTETLSTATIVADKINLISPNGDGGFSLPGSGDGISDKKMAEIIEKAHKLPYGDVLCDFLAEFLKMYQAHFHPYPGLPPSSPTSAAGFWTKYPADKNILEDKLLSKDVRIN